MSIDIEVTCEECNDNLEIVREWASRGDIEVTVKPCKCGSSNALSIVKTDIALAIKDMEMCCPRREILVRLRNIEAQLEE